jgi:hypothetical protein
VDQPRAQRVSTSLAALCVDELDQVDSSEPTAASSDATRDSTMHALRRLRSGELAAELREDDE